MPRIPGLRVVRSSIDGYGVVAERPFAAGEVLADVDGVAYGEGELVDDTYALKIADGAYLDMVDQTRWINHSCEPNARIVGGVAPDGRVWARIVAVRPIAAGEELAYDYAFPAALAERCRCGAARCRGWIVDADELAALRDRGD